MNKIHRPTERVIDILTTLSKHNEGMNLTKISQFTDIPKGTLSPILRTLVDKKILILNEKAMVYTIGIKMFKIGYSFIEGIDMIKIIELRMKDIVEQTDEICQLGMLDGKDVLYMIKEEPIQSIKLESNVGKSLPAHATALGKSLLGRYTDDEILELYKDGMEKITDNTIIDVYKLIDEINFGRKNNISYEWEESNEEVMCLAVPIYYDNKPILSISISIPLYRAKDEKLDLVKDILLIKRIEIENEIRYSAIPDIFKI